MLASHLQKAGQGCFYPSLDVCTVLGCPQVQGAATDALSTNHCQASREQQSRCAFFFFLYSFQKHF